MFLHETCSGVLVCSCIYQTCSGVVECSCMRHPVEWWNILASDMRDTCTVRTEVFRFCVV